MDSIGFLIVTLIVTIIGCVGLALFFMGYLATLATAFGNKHWYWGVAIFLFGLLAIPYCFRHREITEWPRGLIIKGAIMILIAAMAMAVGLHNRMLWMPAP